MQKISWSILLVCIILALNVEAYYKVNSELGYTAEARYHSPIVFIPGMMGSILVNGGGWSGDELWPGQPFESRFELAFQDDGITPTQADVNILATGTVRSVYGSDIYGGFFNLMDNTTLYNYKGKQGEFGYIGRAYFDHPYDFRWDNQEQVKSGPYNLDKFVNRIRTKTHSDQVILIGHSMGGYQTRIYANDYAKKVKAAIFLSSPHDGAPRAFQAVSEGYNFGAGILISNEHMFDIGRNWPGAASITPGYPFMLENGKTLTLEQSYFGEFVTYEHSRRITQEFINNGSKNGQATKAEAEAFFKKHLFGQNKQVYTKMLQFRKYYNQLKPKVRIELINGDKQITTKNVEAKPKEVTFTYQSKEGPQTFTYTLMRFDQINDNEGDGTVHRDGLTWGSYPTVWVEGGHVAMAGQENTFKHLRRLLEEINHDNRDNDWITIFNDTATRELLNLKNQAVSREASGKQFANAYNDEEDKEKRSHYLSEMKGRAKYVVLNKFGEGKTHRINIVVPNAGQYDNQNQDFNAWLVIDGFDVVDSGIGIVKPSDVTITIFDASTIDKVGQGMSIKTAYENKLFSVDAGFMNNLMIKVTQKVMEWINQ